MAQSLPNRIERLESFQGDHLPRVTVREFLLDEPVPPFEPRRGLRLVDFTGKPRLHLATRTLLEEQ